MPEQINTRKMQVEKFVRSHNDMIGTWIPVSDIPSIQPGTALRLTNIYGVSREGITTETPTWQEGVGWNIPLTNDNQH